MSPPAQPTSAVALHPLLVQRRLELRARLRRLWARPQETGFHALALLAFVALLMAAVSGPLAPGLLQLTELLRAWPLSLAGCAFAALALDQRAALRRFDRQCTEGWCAALPVTDSSQRLGRIGHLRGRALLQLLLGMAVVIALRLAGAIDSSQLLTASTALLLLVALATALNAAFGANAAPPQPPAIRSLPSRARGWKRPPSWVGPLPQLAQWQQRAAIRAWRAGRGWVWLLPLWLMIPAGEAGPVLLGLALTAAAIAWLRTVFAASASSFSQAEILMAATPRRAADLCSSGLPYPASRLLMAGAGAGILLGLLGASAAASVLVSLAVINLGLIELALMLRYPGSRMRQRARLIAETSLLLLLAREGLGPLALPIGYALAAWHLHKARTRP